MIIIVAKKLFATLCNNQFVKECARILCIDGLYRVIFYIVGCAIPQQTQFVLSANKTVFNIVNTSCISVIHVIKV